LKKNGMLGRESVLRKSMLDECKGEKFYEVLVLFSTAVLKKTLTPKTTMAPRKKAKRRNAVAKELGMETKLSTDQQASLLPLAIAHKAALVNLLKRKEEKRRKYMEFSELLDKKTEEITQRNQQCKAKGLSRRSMVSDIHANSIEKQLRENWIGNTKWLDTMLYGDTEQTDDRFLNSSFGEVWQVVERGGRLEEAGAEAGLLENLEKRVEEQNERLKRWRSFHEKIVKDKPRTKSQAGRTKDSPPVTLDFKFDDHLKLQLGSPKPAEEKNGVSRKLINPEYQDIIAEMEQELEEVARSNHSRSTIPLMTKPGSSFNAPRSPIHSRPATLTLPPKKSPDHAVKQAQWPPHIRKRSKEDILPLPVLRPTPMLLDSEATLVGLPTSIRPSSQHSNGPPAIESRRTSVPETSTPLPTLTSSDASIHSPVSHQSPLSLSSHYPSEPPAVSNVAANTPSKPPVPTFDPSAAFLSREDQLAENIIASIGAATPSPLKKQPRLSLVERTRMSMAHNTTFQPIAESESPPDLDPLPSLPPTVQPTEKLDRRVSLADRTRMSMAHISAFQPITEADSPSDLDPLPSLPHTVTQATEKLDRRASLLDRTRLSMAAMAANPRPQPKKSRKSKRESIFPVNQFETPRGRKTSRIDVLKEDALPKDELFSEDVDYDTVFKSRPRIAQSPVGENDVEGDAEEFDEGVTGVDLGDVDADEDEGFTEVWDSSPLRRGGRGLGRQSVVGRW
jgi:hypothetical protein